MDNSILDVIIIGAGHSGLSLSFYLKNRGLSHVILEQKSIGNSWSSQRWDSFKLNTPNNTNALPGKGNDFTDPESFCSATEFVSYLKDYAKEFDLPVKEKAKVRSVTKGGDLFLTTIFHDGVEKSYFSKNVVVASGSQNQKVMPALATKIAGDIIQFHAGDYRNSEQLPDGGVLVVGSGQSGVQIADDLIGAGRKLYLATSMVARVPRRYRGKDIMEWMNLVGFNDHRPEDVADPQMLKMKQPQISGVGSRGKTLSLQGLAKEGAVILGKVHHADGYNLEIHKNAAQHVHFGDEFSKKVKGIVDEFIKNAGLDVPQAEIEDADLPDDNASCVFPETSINLKKHNITSIIWSTGFSGNFDYLQFPIMKSDGTLKHKDGVSEINGLYFLGFPWLRKRKSGIVFGIEEDAKYISDQLKF